MSDQEVLAGPPAVIDDSDEGAQLPHWFPRAVLLTISMVLVAGLVVRGFMSLSSLWYTLAFAFFLALSIEPLVNKLAARGWKRGVSTMAVLAGLFTFVALFFSVFGNLLVSQSVDLVRSLPATIDSLVTWANERFDTNIDPTTVQESMGITPAQVADWATGLGLGVLGFLASTVGVVFSGFTMLLFTFYLAAEGPTFRATVASWMTPKRQRTFLAVWNIAGLKAGGYVISRGLMAIASGLFHGVAFAVMGLPYYLAMAMWVGLVSQFVPTIGTYLAIVLPAVLALAQGEWVMALMVVVVATVYQQIENYLVSPKITQATLEVHPAVAFGSVIVGGSWFGPTGALLAIPVVASLQSIADTYGRRYELVPELIEVPVVKTKPSKKASKAAKAAATVGGDAGDEPPAGQ